MITCPCPLVQTSLVNSLSSTLICPPNAPLSRGHWFPPHGMPHRARPFARQRLERYSRCDHSAERQRSESAMRFTSASAPPNTASSWPQVCRPIEPLRWLRRKKATPCAWSAWRFGPPGSVSRRGGHLPGTPHRVLTLLYRACEPWRAYEAPDWSELRVGRSVCVRADGDSRTGQGGGSPSPGTGARRWTSGTGSFGTQTSRQGFVLRAPILW